MNTMEQAAEMNRNNLLRRLATYASVGVAMTLIGVKAYAYLSSNSIGVLVSLLDSVLDLLASAVILISVMYAQRPADRSHRFGHGKAEPWRHSCSPVLSPGRRLRSRSKHSTVYGIHSRLDLRHRPFRYWCSHWS